LKWTVSVDELEQSTLSLQMALPQKKDVLTAVNEGLAQTQVPCSTRSIMGLLN